MDEGQVIPIGSGETKRFDWKTGSPAVMNPVAAVSGGSSQAIQTATLVVHVVNSQGEPVQGAVVKPIGLRSKEEPGSYYFGSPSGRAIAVQTERTDGDGNATISFPARPIDHLTTGAVAVLVEHQDSCTANVELNVDAPRPVTLVRGTKVAFSAQLVPDVDFSRVYADISSDRQRAPFLKWDRSPDGQSVSAHLPDGKYLARVVAITGEGKAYFSASMPLLLPSPIPGDQTISFSVQEGTALKGRLDPGVPRPVKGGWAVAHVTSPELDPTNCSSITNSWRTSADVAEDGSFTLTNLPPGTLEIMAGCDGYVSKDTSAKPITRVRQAQVINADQEQPINISLEPTGAVRVTVRTPDGKPLARANVTLNPNQMLGRGTNILGTRSDSIEMLRNQESDPDALARFRAVVPQFSAKTDASGIAIVKGLPAGQQTFVVQSESFTMPVQKDQPPTSSGRMWIPRRMGTVTVAPAVETSAEVRMETKEQDSRFN